MSYEILPHTAEVGLRATGATIEEAFSEAVRALAEILLDEPADAASARVTEPVSLATYDEPAALAALLEEALFVAETRGRIAVGADLIIAREHDEVALSGLLRCIDGVTAPVGVKAVTYHALTVEQGEHEWSVQAYLDV